MPGSADISQIVVSATYVDEEQARADYERLIEFRQANALEHVHATLLVRDGDGALRVQQHSLETTEVAGLGAVVGIVAGATLAAVFPPLGLAVAAAALAGGVGGAVVGGAVGAAIGHLEGGLSKEQYESIGRVLRAGQAALIIACDAGRASDVRSLLREAELSQTIDLAGASVDDAYDAVGRALASEAADSAHAAAAIQLDVRLVLQYANYEDRAGNLTASEQTELESLVAELGVRLAADAPTTLEQAAIDKADAVLSGLVARAKSVGIAPEPLEELDEIASAFDAADRLARSYYLAASVEARPPAPRQAVLHLIKNGAGAALSLRDISPNERTLTADQAPHVFEAVGATPAEKAAITRGAHVAIAVADRLLGDISEVVTHVRQELTPPS